MLRETHLGKLNPQTRRRRHVLSREEVVGEWRRQACNLPVVLDPCARTRNRSREAESPRHPLLGPAEKTANTRRKLSFGIQQKKRSAIAMDNELDWVPRAAE